MGWDPMKGRASLPEGSFANPFLYGMCKLMVCVQSLYGSNAIEGICVYDDLLFGPQKCQYNGS